MLKNVLITRSAEENLILSQKIKELGLNPLSTPMLSYEQLQYNFAKFAFYKNMIVTSKFAAKIVADGYTYHIKAFVVGEESAEILRSNKNIEVAGVYDNVEGLIGKNSTCNDVDTVYFSGNYISHEIPFATRYIIYNTHYTKEFSKNMLETIAQGRADFIMLYSKNSAINFIDLIKRYKSLQNLQNSVVIAISKEVADIVQDYVKRVFFPKKPNADEMIEILKNL